MRVVFAGISFALLMSGAALGQSAGSSPTFIVADVHASARSTNPFVSGGVLRSGRYELRKATMVDLITRAYDVDAAKVLGGPSWLETDRFDVIATAPPATPPETIRLMLQALLAERFKLAIHKDSKSLPTFALTVGNHAKCYGLNKVGVRRRGYSRETIAALHHAFHLLLSAKLNTAQAIERIRSEINDSPEVDELVRFIESSKRGVVK